MCFPLPEQDQYALVKLLHSKLIYQKAKVFTGVENMRFFEKM